MKKLIFFFLSAVLFANNIPRNFSYNNQVKNIQKKLKNYNKLMKGIFRYKPIINLNKIPENYNPYKYKKVNNFILKKKINKPNNQVIIKIIPKILLNNSVYIKYIQISNNNQRFTQNLWIKPGQTFDLCKFIKIYKTSHLLFKCNKKIVKTQFLPAIKFN